MKQEHIQRAPGAVAAFLRRPDLALWLFALAAPLLFLVPMTHDEIWDLWIGREMLHGARLYRDIIEINPPLWFWISEGLDLTGLELRALGAGLFVAAIGVSLRLTPTRFRLLALVAMVLLPLQDIGQREHFTLIATIPYVFLIAGRSQGETPRHPLAIGLFAAVGLALKPFFVFVPLALELLVDRRFRRPEILTVMAFGAVYAASIPLVTPEYLTVVVPLVRKCYAAFGGGDGTWWTILAFSFAALGALLGRRRGDVTTRTLLVAAVAFLPAVFIQNKGWPYQSIPARGFLFMAIAIELWRRQRRPLIDAPLFAAALICFMPLSVYQNGFRDEMEQHLAGVPRGASIVGIVANPSAVWPIVYDRGLNWELPEMSVWQMQAMASDKSVKPIAQYYVDVGLAKHPDILIVEARPGFEPLARSLIPEGYLNDYVPKARTRKLQSYVRKGWHP